MQEGGLSRRSLLAGSGAFGATAMLAPEAKAFWPALKIGIDALVTLWNGYKMVEEVYKRFFGDRTDGVSNELARIYNYGNFTVNNFYRFDNPHKIRQFNEAEPGCAVSPRREPHVSALCCSAMNNRVLIPAGCVVALNAAVEQLRRTVQDDTLLAYTRPVQYVKPVQPWEPIGASNGSFRTDLAYYSAAASVGLSWVIAFEDGQRKSKGLFRIRDDYSKRIVAEGESRLLVY